MNLQFGSLRYTENTRFLMSSFASRMMYNISHSNYIFEMRTIARTFSTSYWTFAYYLC